MLLDVPGRYVKRRTKEAFREHSGDADAGALQKLWAKAQSDYDLVRRQATVYTLFARKHKSIMVGALCRWAQPVRDSLREAAWCDAKMSVQLQTCIAAATPRGMMSLPFVLNSSSVLESFDGVPVAMQDMPLQRVKDVV